MHICIYVTLHGGGSLSEWFSEWPSFVESNTYIYLHVEAWAMTINICKRRFALVRLSFFWFDLILNCYVNMEDQHHLILKHCNKVLSLSSMRGHLSDGPSAKTEFPASTLTVGLQAKTLGIRPIIKMAQFQSLSQKACFEDDQKMILLTANHNVRLWSSQLLLQKSELLGLFLPSFSWSDNQGLPGALKKRKNLWFISFGGGFASTPMKSIGRQGKELRRNEIDRGWIRYRYCVVQLCVSYMSNTGSHTQ